MPNTKLQTIGQFSFRSSPIESIEIPSNIMQLKEGWCCGAVNLKEVKIVQKEVQNIIFYNKFILGKSYLKSELYDILYFAPLDIMTATIPPFIKKITFFAFNVNNLKILK